MNIPSKLLMQIWIVNIPRNVYIRLCVFTWIYFASPRLLHFHVAHTDVRIRRVVQNVAVQIVGQSQTEDVEKESAAARSFWKIKYLFFSE